MERCALINIVLKCTVVIYYWAIFFKISFADKNWNEKKKFIKSLAIKNIKCLKRLLFNVQ